MDSSLGLVETTGLTAAIRAADAMVKAAGVRVLGRISVGAGLVTIAVVGDVASVQAAVEAGRAAVGPDTTVTAHVLGRPGAGVLDLLTRAL